MPQQPIRQRIEAFAGTLGLYAKRLDGLGEVSLRADDLFVTASVFKVPVLVELYRRADKNEIDLEERIAFADLDRIGGSGVLHELSSGIVLTIRDLALLMTIVSDNVATDILLNRLGIDEVNAMLSEIGLRKTVIRKTSKALLYSHVGMDPNNPQYTYEANQQRLKQQQVAPTAESMSVTASNVSTPREMAHLFLSLAAGELLSPRATEEVLDILSRQQLNDMIPRDLPPNIRVAHKTGSLTSPAGSVRTDAGIVFHPQFPFALACFACDIPNVPRGVDQIAEIGRAIYDASGDMGTLYL